MIEESTAELHKTGALVSSESGAPSKPTSPRSTLSTSIGSSSTGGSSASSSIEATSVAKEGRGGGLISAITSTKARGWRQVLSHGRFEDVEATLKAHKHDLQAMGPTRDHLLTEASQNKHCAFKAVELLVKVYKLDPKKVDKNKQTSLFYCARDGNIEVARYLVELGCSVEQRDMNHQTPIFYAAREGEAGMVSYLASAMANVNAEDINQETPLFWAKDKATCMALVTAGADPRVTSKRPPGGQTAAQICHAVADGSTLKDRRETLMKLQDIFPAKARSVAELGHMFTTGGDLFVVFLGNPAQDLDSLVSLEQEFIDDHIAILDPTQKQPRQKWCDVLGVKERPDQRATIIRLILEKGKPTSGDKDTATCWTLVCRHYPTNTTVGYVHFSIREAQDGASRPRDAHGRPLKKVQKTLGRNSRMQLYIGYVKVQRMHKRKGVASLLLAAVPKHLTKVAEKLRKQPQKIQEIELAVKEVALSVVVKNQAACRMYKKFGFESAIGGDDDDDEEESEEVPETANLWSAMTRRSDESLQSLADAWDRILLAHAKPSPG